MTRVRLDLAPQDAFFVVFRDKTDRAAQPDVASVEQTVLTVSGSWAVSFQPGRGAPEQPVTFATLAHWNESADARIRYFSGVATYKQTVQVPGASVRPGARMLLDLGTVNDLAEVWVNGTRMGVAWHAPYRLDISSALRAGSNELEIRVANRWVNRLVGDVQPGATRYTVTQGPVYEPSAPLTPSGLGGPVRVISVARASAP